VEMMGLEPMSESQLIKTSTSLDIFKVPNKDKNISKKIIQPALFFLLKFPNRKKFKENL